MSLEQIASAIRKCKECRKGKTGKAVPGEGSPRARVVFIGEAPGRAESKAGLPFVGRAGKFLDELMRKIGLKREDVFLTSPVKYWPGRRALRAEEIEHGMVHTVKQIEAISPALIVLLGCTAAKAFLKKSRIGKDHGKLFEVSGKKYFLTFHPASGMRFPKIKQAMARDFEKLRGMLRELGILN